MTFVMTLHNSCYYYLTIRYTNNLRGAPFCSPNRPRTISPQDPGYSLCMGHSSPENHTAPSLLASGACSVDTLSSRASWPPGASDIPASFSLSPHGSSHHLSRSLPPREQGRRALLFTGACSAPRSVPGTKWVFSEYLLSWTQLSNVTELVSNGTRTWTYICQALKATL